MIWPPKSGKLQQYPEVDRADWFGRATALAKIVKGQRTVIERFFEMIQSNNGLGK
jgi:predicted NUDIX family NTP pyrophosphohydrolase